MKQIKVKVCLELEFAQTEVDDLVSEKKIERKSGHYVIVEPVLSSQLKGVIKTALTQWHVGDILKLIFGLR